MKVHEAPGRGAQTLARIGSVVLRQLESDPHPLTADVVRVSDEGVAAVAALAPPP